MVHDSEPISCPWPRPAVDWTDLPALQYAAAYLWFVIASALDLIVTGLILHVGGAELRYGTAGAWPKPPSPSPSCPCSSA